MNAQMADLRAIMGSRMLPDEPLARHTTARVGGKAAGVVVSGSAAELSQDIRTLQAAGLPWKLIGEGSNLLVSDRGYAGVVVINRTRALSFQVDGSQPQAVADSGVNLATLSRQAAEHSLGGFEWACGIPGSVGGAVYGNAGAHGSDMAGNLVSASILHPDGRTETWTGSRFAFGYRSSILKREHLPVVVLQAVIGLVRKDSAAIRQAMTEMNSKRKASQPTGASLGSMFKNPAGDFAGRLIEAAGLKGARIGGAVISEKHANFFLNEKDATAADIYALIRLAQKRVKEQFGVDLETEIELVGAFNGEQSHGI